MFTFRKDPVEKIIADAKEAAGPDDAKANYLSAKVVDGGTQCLVQVHIQGEPGSWIKFNAEQMDEIIRIMQLERSYMK